MPGDQPVGSRQFFEERSPEWNGAFTQNRLCDVHHPFVSCHASDGGVLHCVPDSGARSRQVCADKFGQRAPHFINGKDTGNKGVSVVQDCAIPRGTQFHRTSLTTAEQVKKVFPQLDISGH